MKFRNEDFDCVTVVESESAQGFANSIMKLAETHILIDVQYNARTENNGRKTVYSALVLIKNKG